MEPRDERFVWLRRLRWRVRGAWAAPAFVCFTLLGAVLLARLPPAGDRGSSAGAALIVSAFLNLLMVAVAGPLIGLWLRRRDARLPSFAARDRGTVWALAGLATVLLAAGIAHRPAQQEQQDALRAQALAARDYFSRSAPPAFRRNLGRMDTWKPGPGLYRTCVPGPDDDRSLCVFVRTDQSPPGVTLDRSQQPNRDLAGPYGDIVRLR